MASSVRDCVKSECIHLETSSDVLSLNNKNKVEDKWKTNNGGVTRSNHHLPTATALYKCLKSDEFKIHHSGLFLKFIAVLVIPSFAFICLSEIRCLNRSQLVKQSTSITSSSDQRAICSRTCTLKIVESIPQNVTFGTSKLPESTFSAWQSLIRNCRSDLLIAAYKSSLRGKHVLGVENQQAFSLQGEEIFNSLLESGTEKGVQIRIVENYPPKDKGDNEDAASLHRKGAVYRRHLNFKQILGKGTMHSKFIVSDQKSFYLGSANLDWRSLNQKMELGVVVTNCPCLANDLSNIFNSYWQLTADGASISFDHAANRIHQNEASSTIYNMQNPLRIIHHGLPLNVFIATSPPALNAPHRTWDLDAILRAIDDAKSYLYIHVMDYFPMFIYSKPPRYWPTIDDAVRRAIFRGVEVKMLTAALHYPKLGLPFLSSLESLSGINPNGSIEVRIFKVPTSTGVQTVILRERRTHNKFLVSDNTVVIGTSNWSGDYFDGGSTGAAFVAVQDEDSSHREANIIGSVSLIDEMKDIFLRDWYSEYTHSVADYIDKCLLTKTGSFCEVDKDPALLAENQMQ